jgi:tripartite-type tricarboxylate transporter receptor subunit TctC
LKSLTGMPALHVPYKGGAPSLQAAVTGEVQFTVDVVPTSLPFVRAGRLKAFAVLSRRRSTLLPDVPTVREAGFSEVEADFWSGLVAPAGTPAPVLAKLNAEIRNAVASVDFRERLVAIGAEPQPDSSEEFGAFIAEEIHKWAAVAQSAGVRPE